VLAVVCALLAGSALAGALLGGLRAAPGGGTGTALIVTVTALAAALIAGRVAGLATALVPVTADGAAWPGHPRRRAGGDLPRQHHPDSPGRSRPRAPGAR
jgi:hypothetical protein